MTTETQERIWGRLEALLQEVSGDQPYGEAMREITLLLTMLLEAFQAFATKESVMALLANLEEPSADQLAILEAVAQFVSPILHEFLSPKLLAGLERIPKPSGGRPMSHTNEDRQSVRHEVLGLIDSGLSAAEAKRRVARTRKVHVRTVDRIWAARGHSASDQMTKVDAEQMIRTFVASIR
jgi:hypothetical protein